MKYGRPDRSGHFRNIFGIGLAAWVLGLPVLARADMATLSPTQDSWIAEGSANANHGTDTTLSVRTGSSAVRHHLLIQFDLSSIPVCATVTNAALRLTLTNAPTSSRTEGAHRLSKAWTEGGVTWLTTDGATAWTTAGGDFTAAATGTANTGTTDGVPVQWTVTSDAAAFVLTPSSNRGWLIRDEDETNGGSNTFYGSREDSTLAERPQLVVTYTLNPTLCDDSNACTTDTCTAGGCQHTNNSAACNDGLFCNGLDTCSGGSCTIHAGNPCPGPDGDVNCSESCNEAADNCTAPDPNGTSCRPAAGPCDIAETCSGGVCPTNQFATSGVCRAAAGVCDVAESCDGSGPNCPADAKSTAQCRAAVGVCDAAEFCNGTGNNCPANGFLPPTTACRTGTPGETCDQTEFCTGSGPNCPADGVKPSSAICRAAAGACDLADHCDGVNKFCSPDAKSTAGCRAAAGVCDMVESCDGSSNDCPADSFKSASTVCRAASPGQVCDQSEFCTGSGPDCPPDAVKPNTAVCRAAAGACDLADTCDGTSKFCPADAKSTAQCRAAAGVCDVAENCDGISNTCPANAFLSSSTPCRTSAPGEVCDQTEFCTGSGANCPADGVKPNTTLCRASAGACDVSENCDGSTKFCPADAKRTAQCRAAAGLCDVAESCDGSSNTCPPDLSAADGTGCSDGVFCNGMETCLSGSCSPGTNPCGSLICDEPTDMCLTDSCPSAPLGTCRTAEKSLILIKDKSDDTKDKLVWKFIKGQSTTFAELSDPTTTADYTLCIYSGGAQTLAGTVNIPPSNVRWSVIGNNKGYKYFDSGAAFDGVQKALLKSSTSNKTKALIKGRGTALPGILGPTGLDMPVTAQLINHASSVCWQGSYTGTAKKNTAEQFKAKQ